MTRTKVITTKKRKSQVCVIVKSFFNRKKKTKPDVSRDFWGG